MLILKKKICINSGTMIFLALYNERPTDRTSIYDKVKSFFPPPCVETSSWGTTTLLLIGYRDRVPGIKWPNREANHSRASCVHIKMCETVSPLHHMPSTDTNDQISFHFNPLNPELNPICYLLALLGAHHFLHVSRIMVKLLTFRLLMSYIYGAPILEVSRSHTTTQHSR